MKGLEKLWSFKLVICFKLKKGKMNIGKGDMGPCGRSRHRLGSLNEMKFQNSETS